MEVIALDEQLESIDKQVSVKALRKQTLSVISTLLNPPKVIPTDNGMPRDWSGLAELCGISGEKIPHLQSDTDPTKKILCLWHEKDRDRSTIETLLEFFEKLDRYDVIADIIQLLSDDIVYFKKNPPSIEQKLPDLEVDRFILTRDDVSRINDGLEPQLYDAFVLFADDDIDFATEVIQTMENQYNLKFCVKERDLVAGGLEHEVIIKLISERCNRLIVIISPAFFDSSANKYFLRFAQYIGIENNQRKIIPCIYKHCPAIPNELKGYFMLDYTRAGKMWNFWDKLHDSIRTPKQKLNALTNTNRLKTQVSATSKKSLKSVVLKEEPTEIFDSLQPINHVVKFNSMVNLNSTDSMIVDDQITGSSSANSLVSFPESNNKKLKTKMNWLKKFLKNNHGKHTDKKTDQHNNNNGAEKKKFFSLPVKRKIPVPVPS